MDKTTQTHWWHFVCWWFYHICRWSSNSHLTLIKFFLNQSFEYRITFSYLKSFPVIFSLQHTSTDLEYFWNIFLSILLHSSNISRGMQSSLSSIYSDHFVLHFANLYNADWTHDLMYANGHHKLHMLGGTLYQQSLSSI